MISVEECGGRNVRGLRFGNRVRVLGWRSGNENEGFLELGSGLGFTLAYRDFLSVESEDEETEGGREKAKDAIDENSELMEWDVDKCRSAVILTRMCSTPNMCV